MFLTDHLPLEADIGLISGTPSCLTSDFFSVTWEKIELKVWKSHQLDSTDLEVYKTKWSHDSDWSEDVNVLCALQIMFRCVFSNMCCMCMSANCTLIFTCEILDAVISIRAVHVCVDCPPGFLHWPTCLTKWLCFVLFYYCCVVWWL